MIVLFTDFGVEGPYLGQVKAVLANRAPQCPVVDLCADAPAHDPQAAAYLLAAYAPPSSDFFPPGTVFLCVVDPGVGGERRPLVLHADERWYVGPDNGLLEIVRRRAAASTPFEITWRPDRLSASFHGRDLFAPVAAGLARGEPPPWRPVSADSLVGRDWSDDLSRVIYIDRFGNAMTGLRAAALADGQGIEAGGRLLPRARTFSDVPRGQPFWYENANGLAEIAVNRGRADAELGLGVGAPVIVREAGAEAGAAPAGNPMGEEKR